MATNSLPDCACGAAYADHKPLYLQPESDEETTEGYAPVFFCPGPAAQVPGTTPAVATLYTPVTALTPDQLASET